MKKLLVATLLLTLNFQVHAALVIDLLEPQGVESFYLVLTDNGQIHEVSSSKLNTIEQLTNAKNLELNVEFTFSKESTTERNIIESVKVESVELSTLFSTKELLPEDRRDRYVPDPMENYEITLIKNLDEAKYLFETMDKYARERSQCYNRAYVWAYELHQGHNVLSSKFWLFFTRKYIREFRYKWWFHVTPAVYVQNEYDDEVTIMTMDRKYMSGPTPIKQWTDFFIHNRAYCPQVSRYSSYRNNQHLEYCFLIETNMYFWQPFQIENLETRGWGLRDKWVQGELRRAYRDGFGR